MGHVLCLGLIFRDEIDCGDVCMGYLEENKMEFTNETLDKFAEYANVSNTTTEDVTNSMSKAIGGSYLPLNLQFFAESDPDPQDDPPGDSGKGDKDERTPEQIEFDKKVEAEADRKLESAKQKWEKDQESRTQQLIKDALEEKERLSKLSEKERQDEVLTQREKDLEKRAADIERKELLADAESDLREKELPTSFAEVLLGEDAEKTLENINNFKTAFDEAVNGAVKEKLRQDTPPAGGDQVTTSLGSKFAKTANEQAEPVKNTIWD